jgi:tetratricopeptide (TPR) repeat protein
MGDIDAALRDYDRAIELDSDQYASRSAYYGRGEIYRQRGAFELAISDYSRVLQYAPRYAGAFRDRGLAYAGLGDFNRAITDFDRAIDLGRTYKNEPVVIDALVNRGNAKLRAGDEAGGNADLAAAKAIEAKK